jgi:ribonucleotide reductase alpha subunit
MDNSEINVVKRDGTTEEVSFDKILKRIKKIGTEKHLTINYVPLAIKVIEQMYNGISTSKLDELTADQCASMSTIHYDYSILASRLLISNLHQNTLDSFYDTMKKLYFNKVNDVPNPLVSNKLWETINSPAFQNIDTILSYENDYLFDYFGYKTLEKAYLFKINNKIVERPQHMFLRVSIGLHGNNYEKVKETYELLSNKYFIHATPTLFNSGTNNPQLSSCFLVGMEEDSINGIFNTLKECANISKYAGGIGLHISNVRAKDSIIKGTSGKSDGIVPMLRIFNNTARFVNQGGRRPGSIAIYLEPWHSDIFDLLELKKNHGDEEQKARDLFYGLWVPDLFMNRVKDDGDWYLMSPDECVGLETLWGKEFEEKYNKYVSDNKFKSKIKARDLWFKILDSQMETGTPYILYKDHANSKSNQQNLGTIRSSNLCCEIIEYSNSEESAVCNLASIALPAYVDVQTKQFDYNKLHDVVKVIVNNLNNVIDINFYPTEKTRKSNLSHRPIGIGVQGLADVFFMMNVPFMSDEAKVINKQIFETIYHGSLEKSNELAIERKLQIKDILENRCRFDLLEMCNEFDSRPLNTSSADFPLCGAYKSFQGSPTSKGILQFDMWGITPSDRYDWTMLKTSIIENGLRNSLLVAPMPTASTSQILGYNECFEPLTSNIYSRRTLVGEFIVVNKYLMQDLIHLGLWNETMKQNIIANKGSIQHLLFIPENIRDKYKIVWEIPMKHVIDMAADRGAFICQSQSMNLWMEDPNYNKLTSMHFYSWSKGLKTGIYYLRRKAKHSAQQFTIEPEVLKKNDLECEMCSA